MKVSNICQHLSDIPGSIVINICKYLWISVSMNISVRICMSMYEYLWICMNILWTFMSAGLNIYVAPARHPSSAALRGGTASGVTLLFYCSRATASWGSSWPTNWHGYDNRSSKKTKFISSALALEPTTIVRLAIACETLESSTIAHSVQISADYRPIFANTSYIQIVLPRTKRAEPWAGCVQGSVW